MRMKKSHKIPLSSEARPTNQICVIFHPNFFFHFCNFWCVPYYQDTRNHFNVTSAQPRSASSYREPIQSTSLSQSYASLGKPDGYVRDRTTPRSTTYNSYGEPTQTVKSVSTVTQQGNKRRSINKNYKFLSHGVLHTKTCIFVVRA